MILAANAAVGVITETNAEKALEVTHIISLFDAINDRCLLFIFSCYISTWLKGLHHWLETFAEVSEFNYHNPLR